MEILKISETPRTLARFMGLHLTQDDTPVLLALHMFALYGAFNRLKHNQLPSDDRTLENIYNERLRFAQLRCARLAREMRGEDQPQTNRKHRHADG